jgi:hypothetical protein
MRFRAGKGGLPDYRQIADALERRLDALRRYPVDVTFEDKADFAGLARRMRLEGMMQIPGHDPQQDEQSERQRKALPPDARFVLASVALEFHAPMIPGLSSPDRDPKQ